MTRDEFTQQIIIRLECHPRFVDAEFQCMLDHALKLVGYLEYRMGGMFFRPQVVDANIHTEESG